MPRLRFPISYRPPALSLILAYSCRQRKPLINIIGQAICLAYDA
jgi:hypothetical protein